MDPVFTGRQVACIFSAPLIVNVALALLGVPMSIILVVTLIMAIPPAIIATRPQPPLEDSESADRPVAAPR